MPYTNNRECNRCNSSVSHLNVSCFGSELVCDICYSTIVGNILFYSSQYSEDVVTIARMIAQVGNMILHKEGEE